MIDYQTEGTVAHIIMDDGKANAVGHQLIDALNDALDRAEKDAKAVLLTGRSGVFSAGFDLNEFKKGADASAALLEKGTRLFLRLFGHPQPLIAACTGHAIAAGAFVLLCSDTRLGTSGDYRIGLNETAIGMTLPVFGQELAAARLSKRHLTQALIQATLYTPDDAVNVGFLDQALPADDLSAAALAAATALAGIAGDAYANNKKHARAASLATIAASL